VAKGKENQSQAAPSNAGDLCRETAGFRQGSRPTSSSHSSPGFPNSRRELSSTYVNGMGVRQIR